jgi:hypothetical protein
MLSSELDRVKVIKVKQPWALHLVRGIKDCENRSWKLSGWVAIASSKSQPSKKLLDQLHACTSQVPGYQEVPPSEYKYQYILGLLKVRCFEPDKLPQPTIWHIPPNNAWMVEEAWEFKEPIPLRTDDKFQTSVRLGKRPLYKAEILKRLAQIL